MDEPQSTSAMGPVEHRVDSVLKVAAQYSTGISVDRLTELLPAGAPKSGADVVEWFGRHPSRGTVVNGVVYETATQTRFEETLARRSRGEEYLLAADSLLRSTLREGLSVLRCIGVTGSAAYGEPQAGDDCDFLAVTDTGSLWAFLAFAFLKLRATGEVNRTVDPPIWCFNYVLEDRAALAEFRVPRGFLFAREALTIRILRGFNFYRGLLGTAAWLEREAPRLFTRWAAEGWPSPPGARRAPALVRALNLLAFPLVASYLQMVSVWRNQRLRRAGRKDEMFRVVTRFDRFIVQSRKFDRLAQVYGPSAAPAPG